MNRTEGLPKFKNPPVNEMAVGMQFSAPGFLPTHYGLFHDRVRERFPAVQTMQPLPSISAAEVSTLGEAVATIGDESQSKIEAIPVPPWPRVLLIAPDDCTLVQIQQNRIYFNWRKRPNNTEYPHYNYVRQCFSEIFTEFSEFAEQQNFGPIEPSVCEVLYVNHLQPSETGIPISQPEEVFRVLSSQVGSEWNTPLESLQFFARYPISDKLSGTRGVLSVGTLPNIQEGNLLTRLDITARGRPGGSDLESVLAFHDLGHEAIVRAFAALTTPKMHEIWERIS